MEQLVSANEGVVEEELKCSHCKDSCEDRSIASDDHIFCCHGCKTVFEILHENGLDAYYDIESNPGISLKRARPKDYFDFLENPDIQRRVLDFDSPELSKVHFYIPSIHCSSCIWLLENLHTLTDGVESSKVNFPKKQVVLDFNPKIISLRALVELLSTLGYEPEINLEKLDRNEDKRSATSRKLLIKLGVAGFAFGNIMLFSFPEYLGIDELFDVEFRKFFGYINLLFALPVLFYCSSDYFASAWKGLKARFINIDVPISIGILALFIRSAYEVITFTSAGYFDSLAGLLFFLLLGKWFQNRTYESLLFNRNYKSYFPIAITKESGLEKKVVTIDQLSEGDHILIRNNELIPADSILLSDQAFIDNSFVTGESTLVRYCKGDYIYAGGKQSGPSIRLKIEKEVSQSYLTQLWNNQTFDKEDEVSSQIMVNKISKYFTIVVLIIAFSTGIYWLLNDPSVALNAFTAVLIVACPCALALSTPFTTGNAMRVYGKNEFFVRNGDVIEKMADLNKIVFDKTGTITDQEARKVVFHGSMNQEEKSIILEVVGNSTHPLSQKIFNELVKNPGLKNGYTLSDFKEVPGQGITANVSGKTIMVGSGKFVSAPKSNADGNTTQVHFSIDSNYIGYYEIRNSYRKGFKEIINQLGSDYSLAMLSGDSEGEKEFLEEIFPESSSIRFGQSPYSKLEAVERWQDEGDKVLMLGDGLNDAGALAKSNVGIAVTEEIGTFTPASDVIMSGKSFGLVPQFLNFSKFAKLTIILSFVLSFLYNITGLSFAVAGKLEPLFAAILMPLSSITIVLFTTVAINLFARKLKLI